MTLSSDAGRVAPSSGDHGVPSGVASPAVADDAESADDSDLRGGVGLGVNAEDGASHPDEGVLRMTSRDFLEMANEFERRVGMQSHTQRGESALPSRTTSTDRNLLVSDVLQAEHRDGKDIDRSQSSHPEISLARIAPCKRVQRMKGAFAGVFVPTCENMWGVLIFLRFFFIVGQAGIAHSLLAVLLSFLAALCTTASVSAIASSGGIVSRGGPYYMISRTLGPVLGATVGFMYWLAITMLSVLECIGAVEALTLAAPDMEFPGHKQAVASGMMAALALTVWGGIHCITRLGVLFALVISYTLVAYYLGLLLAPLSEAAKANPMITGLNVQTFARNWGPHYDEWTTFGVILGLFYPCFTGILSGANRADCLRDPPRNIRQGTFSAVIFSFFMYSSLFVLMGSVAEYPYLQGAAQDGEHHASERGLHGAANAAIVEELVWNPFPKSAFIGIIVASLSQAFQCLAVAPRLLQAIAKDRILPILEPVATVSRRGEPVRALLCTYVVAALLVLIGDLNIVAPLLSMCFLVTYAFLNFSCCILTLLKSPAWRPPWIHQRRWRTWYLAICFVGFVLCGAIMFIIEKIWALIAIFLSMCLYAFINFKLEQREWGSALDGIKYRFALDALMQLESSQHARVNWRPQVLILYRVNVAEELKGIKHREILQFYAQLRKGRGFCVVACVLESHSRNDHVMHMAAIEKGVIKTIMTEEGITGFAEVVVAPNWAEGAEYIIQLTGIGGLCPNTVLLDWPLDWASRHQDAVDFVNVLRTSLAANKAVLAVKGLREMPVDVVHGTIDMWWMIHDGGFLLLLSWLLVRHRVWRSCHLRVFTVAENVSAESAKAAAEFLTKTLQQRRLFDVDVEVVLADDEMIQPYTYDWTLRANERQEFLRQLHPRQRPQDSFPEDVGDLFRRTPRCADQRRTNAGSNSDAAPHRPNVVDCRWHDHGEDNGSQLETEATGAPSRSSDDEFLPRSQRKDRSHGNQGGNAEADAPTASASSRNDVPGSSHHVPAISEEWCSRLNQIIYTRSRRAQLVVINLPDVWGAEREDSLSYMSYCDTLTQGLDRVLFVHSTGHEIFDISG